MRKMLLAGLAHFVHRLVWTTSLLLLVAALLSVTGCTAMKNQVAAPRDNARLSHDVAEQIFADGHAGGLKVGITADAGAVVIRGTAASERQVLAVTASAVVVPGVRHVENRLRVKEGTLDGSKNRRTLIEDVREALEASLPSRGDRLLVEADNGVVYLSGIVANGKMRNSAIAIATQVRGVRHVEDNLMSERPETAQASAQ